MFTIGFTRRESGLGSRGRNGGKWFFRAVLSGVALAVIAVASTVSGPIELAEAAPPTMCGRLLEHRPYTVFIDTGDQAVTGMSQADALAGLEKWNSLFRKYHGFDIFVPYYGAWWEADVLVSSMGSATTWVNTPCAGGFVQRGNNQAIVFIGREDASRNALWFAHEMGHVLGISDFTSTPSAGHIGAQPCGNYVGVMSYCSGTSSWFVDAEVPGYTFDGQLVRDYWR